MGEKVSGFKCQVSGFKFQVKRAKERRRAVHSLSRQSGGPRAIGIEAAPGTLGGKIVLATNPTGVTSIQDVW